MQWKRFVSTLEFDGSVFNAPQGLSDARRSISHPRSIDSAMSPHSSAHSADGAEHAECPTTSRPQLARTRNSKPKNLALATCQQSLTHHSLIIMPNSSPARLSPHRCFLSVHTGMLHCRCCRLVKGWGSNRMLERQYKQLPACFCCALRAAL